MIEPKKRTDREKKQDACTHNLFGRLDLGQGLEECANCEKLFFPTY